MAFLALLDIGSAVDSGFQPNRVRYDSGHNADARADHANGSLKAWRLSPIRLCEKK